MYKSPGYYRDNYSNIKIGDFAIFCPNYVSFTKIESGIITKVDHPRVALEGDKRLWSLGRFIYIGPHPDTWHNLEKIVWGY